MIHKQQCLCSYLYCQERETKFGSASLNKVFKTHSVKQLSEIYKSNMSHVSPQLC